MYYISIELLVVSMLTASCSPRPENPRTADPVRCLLRARNCSVIKSLPN